MTSVAEVGLLHMDAALDTRAVPDLDIPTVRADALAHMRGDRCRMQPLHVLRTAPAHIGALGQADGAVRRADVLHDSGAFADIDAAADRCAPS